MNTDTLKFINPYIVATQVIASKREVDLDEILLYCNSPEQVAACGRKNLYKVFSDLFSLYRTNAPRDIYAVTPEALNMYAGAYAKYVLKTDIQLFDDVLGWNAVIRELYVGQNGKAYRLLRPLLELNAYGDNTLEIAVFICNILALALNDQQLILTPVTYAALRQYIRIGDNDSVDELLNTYVRYREFLTKELAFAHFLYIATVQYGYNDPAAPADSIVYVFNCEPYTLKAKYHSGSADWTLTIYNKSKVPMGTVTYSDSAVKCTATSSVTADLLAHIWYSIPDVFTRKLQFDQNKFKEVSDYVTAHGKRQALVVKHLRNNYKWSSGDYTIATYSTPCSVMLNVRKSLRLVGVVEMSKYGCFASNIEVQQMIPEINLIDDVEDSSLEKVLVDYLSGKFTGEPSIASVVHEVVNVLHQYDVTGLDAIQHNLPLARS